MFLNQIADRADHPYDLLGAGISGACLGAEDKDPGLHFKALVMDNTVIEHQNMQRVQQLTLILMKALGLNIEHEIRIDRHILTVQQHLGKPFLVLMLHSRKLLAEGGIIRKRLQFAEPLRLPNPAVSDRLVNQVCQARIAVHQPAAVRNAVGNGRKLFRHYQRVIMEGFLLEDLAVQLADAVHGIAHGNQHIGHMHIVIAHHRHVGNAVPVAGEAVPQAFAQPPVDLLNNLIDSGQKAFYHANRPFFQRFRHDRVICIRNRVLGNAAGFIPAQSFLIHQQAHQLRYRHAGMRIIDMDHDLLRKAGEVMPVIFLEILQNILQRGAGEEISLLQPQLLSFIVLVFRIEYLADGLCQLNFLGSLYIVALAEAAQVNLLRAAG